jgi:hypothetical protein
MVNQNKCALSSWLSFIVSVSTYEAFLNLVFDMEKKAEYFLFGKKDSRRKIGTGSSVFWLIFNKKETAFCKAASFFIEKTIYRFHEFH